MPLEIALPAQSGLPFGPGADYWVVDTTVGPHPVDDIVTLTLYQPDGETIAQKANFSTVQSTTWPGKWTVPDFTTVGWTLGDGASIPVDAPLQLVARRQHADGTLVSQDSRQVKWAPVQFTWAMVWEVLWRQRQTAGFTPSDRDLLEHIDTAVWKPWAGA